MKPSHPQQDIGRKSGLSCPRPNCPDVPKLPMSYISWWSKRANSCCYCPVQGKELGLKLWWQRGHCCAEGNSALKQQSQQ